MEKIQPASLGFDATNSLGAVNRICRFDDHDGQRFIQIHGQSFYSYDLGDSLTERFVWTHLHLFGYASMVEIARATGLSLRSLQRWKKNLLDGGFQALVPKPVSGRPRTITTTLKGHVLRLINQGKSHGQIQLQLKISGTSIDRIVAEEKAKHQGLEQELDLQDYDEHWILEPPEVSAQSSLQAEEEEPREDADPDTSALSKDKEIAGFHSICDPLDRGLDRAMAQLGLLEDAEPLFAPGQRLDFMGFFMIVALLGCCPILSVFEKIYGKILAPAFYGLRTTVMTLLMMSLLRIKRPEHLRQHHPANLGRALGLDRTMEVKTLRRKLHQLAGLSQGAQLMHELGRARLEGLPAPEEGELEILYLDGHVQCYHGAFKIGQTWSATRNRVVKGRTDTWLHLPGQTPLFYLESAFNESLVKVIEKHEAKLEGLFGKKPVLVFDREGWDVGFLDRLDQKGWKFITYRKGSYEALPVEEFEKTPTQIGKRSYQYAPVDIAEQRFNVYEKTTTKGGNPTRRKVGEKAFREVRVLSDDGGHQTSIVSNLSAGEADPISVCAALFERWGNQENVFKYMSEEYALDALIEYNRGDKSSPERRAEERIGDAVDHPNPEYVGLTRQISELARKQSELLARYGLVVEKQLETRDTGAGLDAAQLAAALEEIRAGKHGDELRRITAQLEELRVRRAKCEEREEVSPAGYVRLRSGVKQIADAIKMSAYGLESELFEMLGEHYANRDKEGRKLIVSAMRSSGSLRLEGGKIVVRLEEQGSPNRTAAIDAICRELNQRQAIFPGTDLRIEFDTERLR